MTKAERFEGCIIGGAIADDLMGGFFAINGGLFGEHNFGKIYYFAPDNLQWECLDLGYTDFIHWLLNGEIDQFYKDYKWDGWQEDVKKMNGNQVMSFYPYLFTQYEDYEDLSRKVVPIEESFNFLIDQWSQIRR